MVSLGGLARKLFGSSNDRRVRGYKAEVAAINRTRSRRPRLCRTSSSPPRRWSSASSSQKARRWTTCWSPPSRSPARLARRVLGLRPFDVQLIGGMILHEAPIAEMKTGEGKTLVGDAAGLPQRACRQGRARRHRQRLPGPARRRHRWAGSTASSA